MTPALIPRPDRPGRPARSLIGALLAGSLLALGACEQLPPLLPPPAGSAEVLLMGEQHDQPDHQRQIAAEVQGLIAQGRLAALVLEMVESGRDSAPLNRISTDAQVREALDWDDRGWPWAQYGPAVMLAVRAGVPVQGGNLPRTQMAAVMADAGIDTRLPEPVRARISQAVEDGHCGMLKADQLPAMVRIQMTRDQRMAETVLRARFKAGAGQVVVLHAGEQHVARDRGVPLHLDLLGVPPGQMRTVAFGQGELQMDERRPAERVESIDHCAEFRSRMERKKAAPAPNRAASQAG
jgi:uncharacterized iron-regulated protein